MEKGLKTFNAISENELGVKNSRKPIILHTFIIISPTKITVKM